MLNSSLDFFPQSSKRVRGQEFRNHNESIAPQALQLRGPEPLAPAAALFRQLQPSTMQIPAVAGAGMAAAILSQEELTKEGAITLDAFAAYLMLSMRLCRSAELTTHAPLARLTIVTTKAALLGELQEGLQSEERSSAAVAAPSSRHVEGSSALAQTLASLPPATWRTHTEAMVLRVVVSRG